VNACRAWFSHLRRRVIGGADSPFIFPRVGGASDGPVVRSGAPRGPRTGCPVAVPGRTRVVWMARGLLRRFPSSW
jgi:hypothetical protein